MESCCLPGATQKDGTKEEAKCVHGVPALGERGLLVTTSRKLQVRILGFPGGSDGKESTCKAEDLGLIPGLGRYPGEGNGYPLQYSGLENSIACTIHGVTKSQTWLGDFHTHLQKQGIFSEPREVPLRESYSKFAEYEHQVVAIPAQSDLLSLLSSLLSTLLLHWESETGGKQSTWWNLARLPFLSEGFLPEAGLCEERRGH